MVLDHQNEPSPGERSVERSLVWVVAVPCDLIEDAPELRTLHGREPVQSVSDLFPKRLNSLRVGEGVGRAPPRNPSARGLRATG